MYGDYDIDRPESGHRVSNSLATRTADSQGNLEGEHVLTLEFWNHNS
jgi:hypothetical protein